MPNVMRGVSAATPFVLEDVQEKARQILERATRQAREEAARLLEEARGEAERIGRVTREAAREEGRGEGLAQGREEGRREAVESIAAQWDGARRALDEVLKALRASVDEVTGRASGQVVAVALKAARAVIKRQVSIDDRSFEGNLRAVLALAAKARVVKIHLHPADLKALQKGLDKLEPVLSEIGSVEWVGDEQVGRGGASAVCESGLVDATMETLLAQMEEAILGSPEKEAVPS